MKNGKILQDEIMSDNELDNVVGGAFQRNLPEIEKLQKYIPTQQPNPINPMPSDPKPQLRYEPEKQNDILKLLS